MEMETFKLQGSKRPIKKSFTAAMAAASNKEVVRVSAIEDGHLISILKPAYTFTLLERRTALFSGRRGDQVMVEP